MSISSVFDIASKGLSAYQQALDVTANNISNASNPDYTRQTVVLSPTSSRQIGNFYFGTGVQLSDIQRVRDNLTDVQIRTNNQKYSFNNQNNLILNQIQQLFAEPSSSGLSSLTTAFFNSWQQLSVSPNDQSLRTNVIQAGQNLSNQIQNITDGMNSVKSNILNEVNDKITNINTDIKQIQSLNVQIIQAKAQTSGQPPNDLLDQRDKLINDLSNLADINVTYDSQNSAIITAGGTFLEDRGSYVQLKASQVNGKIEITTSNGGTTVNLNGGDVYALTNLYNNTIPGYQSSLDSFVNNLMDTVNAQHKTGYSSTNPPQTGINFFQNYQNGQLTINPDIINNPNLIAASSDGTSGNGDIALNIAGIVNQKSSDGTTLLDNYNQLIAQIGSDTQATGNEAQSYQLVLNQLQQQKASYSGVSTDEEMTNIIQYQKSYTASAKVIQIANQMMDDLLSMV